MPNPALYDPISKMGPQEWRVVKTSLNEAVEGTDCIVILTGQEQFKKLEPKKTKSPYENALGNRGFDRHF